MDRDSIQERYGIIGPSAALRRVIDRARMVARTDITALIQGESGVGKELIARLIHDLSSRRHEPIVTVNCGAIPEGLIESELFGAEKGAYTGASERRTGFFEAADGGTIFLDEIGEMPLPAQVRLLRVLESGEFTRVGSSTTQRTDVRIVAATNKDLAREVRAGRFREDLYYRLSTVVIDIPPLRDRPDDILPIFETYLHRFTQEYNSPPKRLTDAARQQLQRYRWPGNIRELRNVAEQAVVLTQGETVDAADLKSFLRGIDLSTSGRDLLPVPRSVDGDRSETMGSRERELLYRALVELRLEFRELKDRIEQLASGTTIAVPREAVEPAGFSDGPGEYVIVREDDRDDLTPDIEDVTYEIEQDDLPRAARDEPEPRNLPVPLLAQPANDDPEAFPTLEDAEQQLITAALKRFGGNRRQTARALGISERTLYRKLKEIDEDL